MKWQNKTLGTYTLRRLKIHKDRLKINIEIYDSLNIPTLKISFQKLLYFYNFYFQFTAIRT